MTDIAEKIDALTLNERREEIIKSCQIVIADVQAGNIDDLTLGNAERCVAILKAVGPKPIPLREPLDTRIAATLAALTAYQADRMKNDPPACARPSYVAEKGPKNIRIVEVRHGDQRSAYAFLDREGNIYKPDGWNRPAKHVRGNIYDTNYSIGKAFGPYGVAYLR
jgi:hypothetical protein